MPEARTLQDRISELLSSRMHLAVPSVETDLFETGALDSLTFVDLLLHLEEGFGIKTAVEDLEIENFRSIASIARFIVQRHEANNGHGGASGHS